MSDDLTAHDHSTRVDGCFRCDLSADEAIAAADEAADRIEALEAERDAALADVAKLRETVAAIREHADRGVAWSLHTRQIVRDLCDSVLAEEATDD